MSKIILEDFFRWTTGYSLYLFLFYDIIRFEKRSCKLGRYIVQLWSEKVELKWIEELVEVLKKRKKSLIGVGIILLVVFYFLPEIGYFYFWLTSMVKVDSSKMNFSRLNLLQVLISILSPVLTFLVLMNSVANQKSTNKRLDQQSEEAERRINSEQVSNAFYKLLEVFTNIQKQVSIQKIKENINNLYSTNSWDFYLENGYCSNDGRNHQLEWFLYESNIKEDIIRYNSDEENMAIVVNMRFEELYAESSQYFKAFHRIVKILNVSLKNNKIDKEEYHSYIGILRANLSSNEMEILLINSLFVKRGIGLGLELVGTDFFGNKNDFDINQHFINIWKESKKELMNIFIDDIKNKNIELRNEIKEYFREIDIKDVNNFDDLYKQYKSYLKKN